MKTFLTAIILLISSITLYGQIPDSTAAYRWADSVFQSLTDDQRIAQLMVLRESSFSSEGPVYYADSIEEVIKKYNIGGVVLFQGSPVKQAGYLNHFQKISQTPLMVCIDAEWGLGMRMDSVIPLNHQMMLGAMDDSILVYEYGRLVGRQCRRMGIHVNYAPVVDINNNPANPVINDRSFGENKFKVARFGTAYMHGMQDMGIMACAKHFPGHGDVSVDSHKDLPVINKSLDELNNLELYPFKKMFDAGVASVMIAHLYIPAIDPTEHTASSISKKTVTGLLRNRLGFHGLSFTDALGMKGVAKYFPGGQIAAQSLIAGNDMLCLPESVPDAIASIRAAIGAGKLTWNDIYEKCRKVLLYKYFWGMAHPQPIEMENLTEDLNEGISPLKTKVAREAITLLSNQDDLFFPLKKDEKNFKIAYVGLGLKEATAFSKKLKALYQSDNFYFGYDEDATRILSTVELIRRRYDAVIIGLHNYARYPANQFGISAPALDLAKQIMDNNKTILFAFGNPYAVQYFCDVPNLVVCYEDDSITQSVAVDLLRGRMPYQGTLPVSVCPQYPAGTGIITKMDAMPRVAPEKVGINSEILQRIDSIAMSGVKGGGFPGCVVLAARNGKIFYEKAFGKMNYDTPEPATAETIYDLASVTKILATTISVMKLYDEGKIKLHGTLGDYLPWVRGSDKEDLTIEDIMLHEAGLVAWIPFYRATIDPETGVPLPQYYRHEKSDSFSVRVAQHLYLRTDYIDTMYQIILDSKLGPLHKYIYSDNDFIFMGKIVEAVSGLPLDQYAENNFYIPLGLKSTGFLPRQKFDTNRIAPTEFEKQFRMQHLHGDVHDPGSAMFGGVAGHAGLFSTVENMAVLLQMLENGGSFGGEQYIKTSTIEKFTAYNTAISRRGIGFDKPVKDNYTTKDPSPYPARYASPLTYGHTGYTGTCIWVDPKYDLVYVFLSNRVNPEGGTNVKMYRMNIRSNILDTIYRAMVPPLPEVIKREGKPGK